MRTATLAALIFVVTAVVVWAQNPGGNGMPPGPAAPGPGTPPTSQGGSDSSGGVFRSTRGGGATTATGAGAGAGMGVSAMAPGSGSSSPADEPQASDDHPVAATLADARDNMASLVETYVAAHGQNGLLPLKTGPKGPARLLRLQGIEKGSVRMIGGGHYSAVVLFRDKAGHAVSTRAEADFSGSDWHVTRISTARPAKKDKDDADKDDNDAQSQP